MRVPATSVPGDTADPGPIRAAGAWPSPAALLVAGAGSTLAAGLVVTVLVLLQDAFRIGATASGLNPGGGGPGVLIMAPPAIAAFLVVRWAEPRGHLARPSGVAALAVLGMALQCLVLFALGGAVLPADFPSLEPHASAAAMAWLVPLAVMATLART